MEAGLYSYGPWTSGVFDSIPSYGTTPVAVRHNLPFKPALVRGALVCISAELGYSVGDEVDVMSIIDTAADHQPAYTLVTTDSGLTVVYSDNPFSSTTPYWVRNKSTQAYTKFTAAKWVVRVYLLAPGEQVRGNM